jgi:predicted negative regulator of RcsB-dependent stress response
MARAALGRSAWMAGHLWEALAACEAAEAGFKALAQAGDEAADRMAAVCLTEAGDVLAAAGQLDAAAERYEEALARGRARGDLRSVAVGTGQLGALRL